MKYNDAEKWMSLSFKFLQHCNASTKAEHEPDMLSSYGQVLEKVTKPTNNNNNNKKKKKNSHPQNLGS